LGNVNICPGQLVTLVGENSFNGSTAFFFNGDTLRGVTPLVREVGQAGSYTFQVEKAGCRDTSDAIVVNIPTFPTINAGLDRQFCISENTFTITGFSPALSDSVSFVENYITGNQFNPANAGIGTKTITLEARIRGCRARDTAIYTVVQSFVAQATPINSTVCFGDSAVLTAAAVPSTPGAIYRYQWFRNGRPLLADTNVTIAAFDSGAYTVAITLNECTSTSAPANVDNFDFRPVFAGDDAAYCANDLPLTLQASPSAGSWTGNGVNQIGQFTPANANLGPNTLVYTTVQQGQCILRDTVIITVKVVPVVKASYTSEVSGKPYDYIDILEAANLSATGANTYVWSPAVALSSTQGSPVVAKPRVTQLYSVIGDLDGCKSSDTVVVKVRTDVRVANAMSPNGDGENDFWNIYNIQAYPNAEIRVYNRWGALVYKAKGSELQNFGDYWNGKSEGKDVPVGVYYYTIDLGNNQKPFIGSVTLVR
jgi:gliding motility-associated-like protein